MPLFEPKQLFIRFIADDLVERFVLFNNHDELNMSKIEIDLDMFRYIEISPLTIVEYSMWCYVLDRINNTLRVQNPDLTMAMAMYMKKMGIPAVKHGE